MFCRYCGNRLPNEAIFCNRCGRQQNITANPGENVSQNGPLLLSLNSRMKGRWIYVIGGCILLLLGILLYWGITPKASPELPEIPESPQSSHTYNDVSRYQCYATVFWQGSSGLASLPSDQCTFLGINSSLTVQPFHMLPIEYPFLTITLFSIGLIVTQANYQVAFAFGMTLIAGIIYLVLQRYRSTQSAIAFAVYLVLGSWATAAGRFDIAPAALTIGAVILAGRARWKSAFSLLALATLLKFYPIMLILPFLIFQQAQLKIRWMSWQRWKAFGIFICICIAITLLSFAVNFNGTLNPIHYFMDRPIQVESLPASLLWLGNFVGYPVDYIVSFQSFNFLSPLSSQVDILSTLCLIVGVLYIGWLQWRGNVDIYMASLLTLLIILVTSKVFSAQYIIWLTPLVAYVGKCKWKWLISWGSICLLTTTIFPYMYANLDYVKEYYLVILLRNGMLLAFLCTLLYHATFSRLVFRSQHYSTLPNSVFASANVGKRLLPIKLFFLSRR